MQGATAAPARLSRMPPAVPLTLLSSLVLQAGGLPGTARGWLLQRQSLPGALLCSRGFRQHFYSSSFQIYIPVFILPADSTLLYPIACSTSPSCLRALANAAEMGC